MIHFPSAHSGRYRTTGKLMTINDVNVYAYWLANSIVIYKTDGTLIYEGQPFTEYLEILDVNIEDAVGPQDVTFLVGIEKLSKVTYQDMEPYQGKAQRPAPDPAVTDTVNIFKVEARMVPEFLNIS